jgi:hypothetical protein
LFYEIEETINNNGQFDRFKDFFLHTNAKGLKNIMRHSDRHQLIEIFDDFISRNLNIREHDEVFFDLAVEFERSDEERAFSLYWSREASYGLVNGAGFNPSARTTFFPETMLSGDLCGARAGRPDGLVRKRDCISMQLYHTDKNSTWTGDNIQQHEPGLTSFVKSRSSEYFHFVKFLRQTFEGPDRTKVYTARAEYRLRSSAYVKSALRSLEIPELKFYEVETRLTFLYKLFLTHLFNHIFSSSMIFDRSAELRLLFLDVMRSLFLGINRSLIFIIQSKALKPEYRIVLDSIVNYNFPYLDRRWFNLKQLRLRDQLDHLLPDVYFQDMPFGTTIPQMLSKKHEEKIQAWNDIIRFFNGEQTWMHVVDFLNDLLVETVIYSIPKSCRLREFENVRLSTESLGHHCSLRLLEPPTGTTLEVLFVKLYPEKILLDKSFWFKNTPHVYMWWHLNAMLKSKDKLLEKIRDELKKKLASWDIYPFVYDSRIWGNSTGNLAAFQKDFSSYTESLQGFASSTSSTASHKEILQELFKLFLCDLWESLRSRKVFFSMSDSAKISEAISNQNLQLLYETFQVVFLEKSSFPFKKVKKIKSTKTWNERFQFFFPINGLTQGDLKKAWKNLSYCSRWNSFLQLDMTAVAKLRAFEFLYSLFMRLEWIPGYRGRQQIWDQTPDKRYKIYLSEMFHQE